MVVLRPTAKLLPRLGVTEATPPKSTTRLGDWYLSILRMRGGHFILAIAESTLLPVVLPARELKTLAARLPGAVGDVLSSLGIASEPIEAELAAMSDVRYARTNNRSTVGVLM